MNMKKVDPDLLLKKFFRCYEMPFTEKEIKALLNSLGISATIKEVREFLRSEPNVLELDNGKFLTRSAAFTGELFSFLPAKKEFDQGVFVVGDRFMPFIDPEIVSSSCSLYINGRKIPRKTGTFDREFALELFKLYGDEFAAQYVASDAANDFNLSDNDFELPPTVKLSGFDLNFLKQGFGYNKGDRILCCVTDWDSCKLNLMVIHENEKSFKKGENVEKRFEWYNKVEEFFTESLKKFGPLGSIEDQLVSLFFDRREELCVPYCGSIEEFLNKSKKIDFEPFGVETRIWFKDEYVPALGEWNKKDIAKVKDNSSVLDFDDFYLLDFPDYVLEQYIYDALFDKAKSVPVSVIKNIKHDEFVFSDEVESRLYVEISECYDEIKNEYNWFADQKVGPVRKSALDLFFNVSVLVRKIDYYNTNLENFSQQELVILSQLYNHIQQMLQAINFDPAIDDIIDDYEASLEGMEWSFEQIKPVILDCLEKDKKKSFKLVDLTNDVSKKNNEFA